MLFNKLIYLIFIFFSCYTIGDLKFNDDYLPDLKIKNVTSQYIAQEIPKPRPDQPASTMRVLIDIEFYILLENIVSGDWKNDLCISYNFEEYRSQTENSIILKDLIILYASSQEVNFIVKNIFQRPKSVTFIMNSSKIDSIKCRAFSEELFYNNNTYKYNLN